MIGGNNGGENMDKTLCQRCFHYEACKDIDLSGAMGNPEMENFPCRHFVDVERVKIQDKANWREKINRWGDGQVCVNYYCTSCGQLERVKIFSKGEWENYYNEHYREVIELPKFCKVCGAIIGGIVEDHRD